MIDSGSDQIHKRAGVVFRQWKCWIDSDLHAVDVPYLHDVGLGATFLSAVALAMQRHKLVLLLLGQAIEHGMYEEPSGGSLE